MASVVKLKEALDKGSDIVQRNTGFKENQCSILSVLKWIANLIPKVMWYDELVRETSPLKAGNSSIGYWRQLFFFLHFSAKDTVIQHLGWKW